MPPRIVYDPYDYEIDAHPQPVWQRLRDEAPLYRNAEHDFWAISRFQDVLDASLDWQTFSSAHGTVLELMSDDPSDYASMIFTDPPHHDELRSLVSRAFTPKRVAELEGDVRALASEFLDERVAAGGFDYVQDFAARLPTMVIGSLLGVPEADRDRLRHWTDQMLHREPDETEPGEAVLRVMADLGSYMSELIAERRRHPGDDLISALVGAELQTAEGTRRLDHRETLDFVLLLFSAGNETVARLLGFAAVNLAEHPDQAALLVEDPSLIPNAIEELLRYEAPSPVQGRWVARDVELHGTVLPRGSRLLMLTGAAGRDEREYEHPDTFDVTRRFSRHLSFGYGVHFCLGAALARLEARVALEETLVRIPIWEVDRDRTEMVHTSTVRGYERVPITT